MQLANSFCLQSRAKHTNQGQDGSVLGISAWRPRLESSGRRSDDGERDKEEMRFEVGAGRSADEIRSAGPIGAGETRAAAWWLSLWVTTCTRNFC